MTPERLTPKIKVVPVVRNVPASYKEVPFLKPSSVHEKKSDVVVEIRKVTFADKGAKLYAKKHQVYLKKKQAVLHT